MFHNKKTSFLSRSFDDKKKTLHINTTTPVKKQEPDEVISSASASSSSSSSYNSSRSETTLSSSNKKIDFNKDQIKKFANSNQQEQHVTAIHLDDLTQNKIKKQNDSIRMRHHSNANKIILNQADLVSSGSVLNVNNSSCVLVASNNKNEDQLKEMSSSASLDSADKEMIKCIRRSKREKHSHNMFIIILLFVVNLLNFIDRYTLAGTFSPLDSFQNQNNLI